MRITWVFAILLTALALAGPLYAGSVYHWTDENGVRHYSNTGHPEEVVEADVRPEETSPAPAADASGDTEGSENEPPVGPGGTDLEESSPSREEQFDNRLAAKAAREREWLQSEIKRVNGLSIGKSFTPGMKDAQLRPLQEQLSLLSADPERYFRMKRQGAFKTTPSTFSEPDNPSLANPLGGRLSSAPGTSSGGSSANDAASRKETKAEKPSGEDQQN